MIKDAFNAMVNFQGRTMTISRPGSGPPLSASTKFAISNYHRNLETFSETVSKGMEFVCSKKALDLLNYPAPKRGDKLADADLGIMTISEVNVMYDVGSVIIGYRVRTS